MNIYIFRLAEFKTLMYQLFHQEHSQSVTVDSLKTYLTSNNKGEAFTASEIEASIDTMSDDNMIMLSNDIIFLIWTSFHVSLLL